MTPSVPRGVGSAVAAAGQTADRPRRYWMQQVETGEVRTVDADEAARLAPPWHEITSEQAVREHMKRLH